MKVTVLTSIFKGKKHLPSFLQDIIKQTIFDQCEWFLLDAASPDDEYSIIEPYLKQYKNIRYERLEQDPGIYGCWNYMIKNSDSDYLTNANIDDRMFPTCLEEHVSELDNNYNTDVVYCYNVRSHTPNLKPRDINSSYELFATAQFHPKLMIQCNLPHSHPVWKRSLHDRFGYFSTEYASGSDWDFWLRCTVGGVQMRLIKQVLGIYYQNPEGISTKQENMKRNLEEVDQIRRKYMRLISIT